MTVTFTQAILIALWAGFAGIDQFDLTESLHRPIVTGLIIGLILGDVEKGLMVGASLELVWVGLVPLAGAQPPNPVVGGVFGVSIAIISGLDYLGAVAIAFPIGIIGQMVVTLLFSFYSPMMSLGDKAAENADSKTITFIIYLQMAIRFILFAIPSYLLVLYGSGSITSIIENAVVKTLMPGLGVAGGMMTAIGFALLLNIMLKKEYFGFLILGFVLAAYLHLDALSISLIALSIVLYDYYRTPEEAVVVKEEGEEDGI